MRKLMIVAAISILAASCKKGEGYAESKCEQCYVVVTDSLSGDYLYTQYGSPDPSAMLYCDEQLAQAKRNYPQYWVSNVLHISKAEDGSKQGCKTRKFTLVCDQR